MIGVPRIVAAALALAAAAWSSAADSGALVFSTGGDVVRFDLATHRVATGRLAGPTFRLIGYSHRLVTEFDVETSISAKPSVVTIRLHDASLAKSGELPAIEMERGRLTGPVQPSPDGRLFALQTQESRDLHDAPADHVSIIDAGSRVRLRLRGYTDPAWIDDDRLVVAAEDGLYLLSLRAGGAPRRIGAVGRQPAQPSVSPDGRAIAFAQGNALWRIGVDGSGLQRLTRPRPGQSWPSWSPDGARVVLARGACPLFGTRVASPELVIVSSTASDQDVDRAEPVMRDAKQPVRSCGPVYWTR
jgi:dipeptidyl aminopeptidase/acylaminoacyl peptidase